MKNRFFKKAVGIILASVMVLGLFGCSGNDNDNDNQNTQVTQVTQGASETEGNSGNTDTSPAVTAAAADQNVNLDDIIIQNESYKLPLSVSVNDYDQSFDQLKNYSLELDSAFADYVKSIEISRNNGADALSAGLNIMAEYFFNYSASCVTSVRFGIDQILKGKGVTLPSEGRFGSWNEVYSVSYVNPVAYYMNCLAETLAGNMDRAGELYDLAMLNEENMPNGYTALDTLAGMSNEKLLEMREVLIAYENYIFDICPVSPTGWEAEGYEFTAEFYMAAVSYCLESEDYETALEFALGLLRIDPIDISGYELAALTAIQNNDGETAWYVIKSGIPMDKNGVLLTLGASLWAAVEEYEMAEACVDAALSLDISAENRAVCESIQKDIKEGK